MASIIEQQIETAHYRLAQLKLKMQVKDYQALMTSDLTNSEKAEFVGSADDNLLQYHVPVSFNMAAKVTILTPLEMVELLDSLPPQKLIFDTETFCPFATKNGALSRYYNKTRLVQIGDLKNNIWIADMGDRDSHDMSALTAVMRSLQRHQLIMHNAIFDISSCGSSTGVFLDCHFDTRIALQVLHGVNNGREIGLSFGLKGYCAWLWKMDFPELGGSDWSGSLTNEQLAYAAEDIVLTRNLYHLTQHLIERPFLLGNPQEPAAITDRLATEFGIIKPLAESESRGAFLPPEWHGIYERLAAESDILNQEFVVKYGVSRTKLAQLVAPYRITHPELSRKYPKPKAFLLNCPEMGDLFTDYRLLNTMFQYLTRLKTIIENLDLSLIHI
jgi:hypothetical protein